MLKISLIVAYLAAFALPSNFKERDVWGWQLFCMVPIYSPFIIARSVKSAPDLIFAITLPVIWISNFTWIWTYSRKIVIVILAAHGLFAFLMLLCNDFTSMPINYVVWTVSLFGLHILRLQRPIVDSWQNAQTT
jgi:hypothetical protein